MWRLIWTLILVIAEGRQHLFRIINSTQNDYNRDLCLCAQTAQSCVQGEEILAPVLGIPKAKVVR